MAQYYQANCMGYALRINDWLVPDTWDYSRESMPKELEENFSLKPVSKKEMKLGKEYIAFRWGSQRDSDFHFMRRGKKGHWSHKRGDFPVETISQKEVFSPVWFNGPFKYDSKIYLFEVGQ